MIRFVNASKVFANSDNKVIALDDVTLTIERGDIFGIIGYSGAGKSTLIRCINGLEKPTDGDIFVFDEHINGLSEKNLRNVRKKIGMIFQHFNLLSSCNVFENIAYPLKGLSKIEKQNRVKELLELVDLEDKETAYPSQLSGGQKQRVAIARALANNPDILLCDEATSALDPQTTKSILQLIKKINKQLGITVVLITHQMEVIKEICNKIAILEKGKVIEKGSIIDVLTFPQTSIAKEFLIKSGRYERLTPTYAPGTSTLVQLRYVGDAATQPLISEISKKFDITANIIFSTIEKIQDIWIGNLVIELQGQQRELETTINYIRAQKVQVEVIDDERTAGSNSSKCS